jgi:hypothetical protein
MMFNFSEYFFTSRITDFPIDFPKDQVTWIDLHPQHLLHRLLIEAALKDAPPL